jgi:hypothetical protein
MKRRFEEILEECLSAQSEGGVLLRRACRFTPAWPEPGHLRTAATSPTHLSLNPPAYLLERGRFRFIAASSERRLAREIARGVGALDGRACPGAPHWGCSARLRRPAPVIAGAIVLIGGGTTEVLLLGRNAPSLLARFARISRTCVRSANQVQFKAGWARSPPKTLTPCEAEALAAPVSPQ